ncbi:MAG: hypothetical protein L0Z68_04435 [Gammaproteobacteria bacterium]|nr:hypothetical protein [Gammaproteobacteria bacterium]
MPILERDPWRTQYFEGVPCPDNVNIPTDDADSYRLYPQHCWVYNKLLICETQGLDHGPHGIMPPRFPVFSKPIYNMRGMGSGSKVVESPEEYEREQAPGHMWMPLLMGQHVSSDTAVVEGESVWWRHAMGMALGNGMFDYWTVLADPRPTIEQYCGDWLRRNLKGYTGMINFETIGGKIIECHLRFADQWVDLYGPGWVESLVELYAHRRWTFRDDSRRAGYSVVLFGRHGLRYKQVERSIVTELLQRPGISSIQITFHENKPPKLHPMPPGGFRLAIINCWDLDAGFDARERLAGAFWSTQRLRVRRSRPHNSPGKV